jgi:hypothetical protein
MTPQNPLSRNYPFSILAALLVWASGCSTQPTSTASQTTSGAAGIDAAAVATTGAGAQITMAATQDEPAARSAKSTGAAGSISEAPSNIRTFSPEESAVASTIAADKVDLRQIFEDLGPDATLWYQHVQTLANPFFGGRAPGTEGGELAASYIEFYFNLYDLEPAFPGLIEQPGGEATAAFMSHRQPFDFRSPNPDVRVIAVQGSINGMPLNDSEFTVLGNSGNKQVTGPVTFVGYGIEEGPDGYSSFDADTKLDGRIALVLRYEPLTEEGRSRWSPARFSRHSAMTGKMKALADRGAAAIILVNPPDAVDGRSGLESIKESGRFGARLNIPVIQITPEAADRMLKLGDPQRRTLLDWRKRADNAEIKTVDLGDDLEISITTELDVKDRLYTHNVGGVLRGKGSLADEWIVIGGHYDHLGFGYTGAMPNNVGQLHPGADDNASGVAAVLIAARRLAKHYDALPDGANVRSIMFLAFGAEEAGLHGSKFFVDNLPISTGSISLMINMDMVGRLRSDNLMVQGTGTAKGFDGLLRPHFESSGLKIAASPGGTGPSDHSSFYRAGIPVLFLFTGVHDEYHRPGDRAYTVNPAGAMKVIELLESIAKDIASRPERLEHVQTSGGGQTRAMNVRVRLGVQPDYAAELETGVLVDSVGEGTSAAEAGIMPGDIMLAWNDEELTGGQKLFEMLGKANPGDRVRLTVQRGDKNMFIEAVLKARASEE